MIVKTIKGKTLQEIEIQLDRLINNGYKPNLSILFCSISQDLKRIMSLFQNHNIDIFGSTTAGEIFNGEILENSIACMLFDINKDYYKIYFAENKNKESYEIAKEAAIYAKEKYRNPSILIASGGLMNDGDQIICGLNSENKKLFPTFGCLAADDFNMKSTFAFTNSQITDNGIVCLIFNNDKISVSGIAASGWRPIGLQKTITKSKGNIVFTIDDEPALDLFLKLFDLSKNLADTDIIKTIGVQYPLQVIKNGYSVIRAPIMGDAKNRALIFAGAIPKGSKVKFSVPPSFEVIDETISEISKLKDASPEADALILFSCKARHLAFGPLMEEEITGIKKIWNSQLVGIFSYGEFGKVTNGNYDFYNETATLVVLKEN